MKQSSKDISTNEKFKVSNISVIENISTDIGLKYSNISNISANIDPIEPQKIKNFDINPSIEPSISPISPIENYSGKRFSDILLNKDVVSLPNPNSEEISVGQENKKFERKKRGGRKKKEEEWIKRSHLPISRYFLKGKPSISIQGKRKISISETIENTDFKRFKEG